MSAAMGASRAITCPSCGGAIEVRAAGYTVTLACQHCGSLLDITQPDVQIITAYNDAARNFAIALGTRCTLFATEWQVIGALERLSSDSGDWQEFLLFNPYAGYRWLVAAGGEWQFGTMLVDRPEGSGDAVNWRGEPYSLAGVEIARTKTVLGEFYWKVARGDEASAATYEGNGDMLSREEIAGEVTWTQLVPVEGDLLVPAAPAAPAASRFADVPSEPNSGGGYLKSRTTGADTLMGMFGMAVIALLVIMLVQGILGFQRICTKNEAEVLVGASASAHPVGTIEAGRPWQYVTIRARGDNFTNRWVDLDYSLVNRKTQQSIDAYGIIEFYTGMDTDGPWSEGSQAAETLFAGMGGGTYDVYVDTEAHGWPSDPVITPSTPATDDATGTWPTDSAAIPAETANAWAPPEKISVQFEACIGGFSWGLFWIMAVLLFAPPTLLLWARQQDI